MLQLDVNLVDVHAVIQRIDAVADISDALATDLDVIHKVGTGKNKVAAMGFLPSIHQVNAGGLFIQNFGLASMEIVADGVKKCHAPFCL